jgi:hypothetical protein
VQLDDDLANRLDQLASEWGTSRSELLSVGAIAVLEAADLIRPTMNFEVLIGAFPRIPTSSSWPPAWRPQRRHGGSPG